MQYCQIILREHIRKAVYRYRKSHDFTQQKMAELLRITLRAYCDLEHGKHSFSLLPFISFLFLMLEEENGDAKVLAFLHSCKAIVEQAEKISD